jgi:hypothetical protein
MTEDRTLFAPPLQKGWHFCQQRGYGSRRGPRLRPPCGNGGGSCSRSRRARYPPAAATRDGSSLPAPEGIISPPSFLVLSDRLRVGTVRVRPRPLLSARRPRHGFRATPRPRSDRYPAADSDSVDRCFVSSSCYRSVHRYVIFNRRADERAVVAAQQQAGFQRQEIGAAPGGRPIRGSTLPAQPVGRSEGMGIQGLARRGDWAPARGVTRGGRPLEGSRDIDVAKEHRGPARGPARCAGPEPTIPAAYSSPPPV